MLSILIPTYNYAISRLVTDLHLQAEKLGIEFEIIVMEDGSVFHVEENKSVGQLPSCRHILLTQNIGRAAIRNKLADSSRFSYLLFIDCDAYVNHQDFLYRYLPFCKSGEEVIIIGGTAYDSYMNNPNYSLRLKYGREREANYRYLIRHSKKENFATFNFLISKSIFQRIRFNEEVKSYGHEDTLFGHKLHEMGYHFQRIDNPLIHAGIDTNEVFLRKTEEAVKNLYTLYQSGQYPFLSEESMLLRSFLILKKWHLTRLCAYKFYLIHSICIRILKSKTPSLFIYDIYKLLYLCSCHEGADKLS